MKKRARRATAIERANLVFMARDYSKALSSPGSPNVLFLSQAPGEFEAGDGGQPRVPEVHLTAKDAKRTQRGAAKKRKENSLRSWRTPLRPLCLIKALVESSVAPDLGYQLHPYDLSAASCCAAACLQAAARLPLVAGFSASFFQEARH